MLRPLLDLLVPPRCLGCASAGDEPFCASCAERLLRDGQIHHVASGFAMLARYRYDPPLDTAIKRVKTKGLRAGATALATLMRPNHAAAVTWVPATARRRRRRGLDLAEVLAGPGAVRLLRRTRDAPDQPSMDARARLRAPWGTFEVTTSPPPHVVLVDDVRATGATLTAAAATLRAAGARRVLGLTLAASGGPPRQVWNPRTRDAAGRRSAASAPTSSPHPD